MYDSEFWDLCKIYAAKHNIKNHPVFYAEASRKWKEIKKINLDICKINRRLDFLNYFQSNNKEEIKNLEELRNNKLDELKKFIDVQ